MEKNIREQVIIVQNEVNRLKKTGLKDPFDLEMKILDWNPEFYDSYPSLVKRLCKDEELDNTYLYKMLDLIEDIQKGEKTMATVEYNLGQELAEKFVYPVVKKEEKNKNCVEELDDSIDLSKYKDIKID
jgi:hypothetical protein